MLPKRVFIVLLPQYTANDATKGEEAVADKSAKLPTGSPFRAPAICAGCRGATAARRQYRTGRTPGSSPSRLLLRLSQPGASAVCLHAYILGTAPTHLNWGQTAELPALQTPFSSGKPEAHPPGPYRVIYESQISRPERQHVILNSLFTPKKSPLIQDYQIKLSFW